MFGLGPATKIFIATESVDMRKGFEGLHGLVRDHLGHDPLSGHLFLFTNRTRTRLKALVWDGSGFMDMQQTSEERPVSMALAGEYAEHHDASRGTGNAHQWIGSQADQATRLVSAFRINPHQSLEHFSRFPYDGTSPG